MNIMILVNKDFEYAGYRESVEHLITSKKTPHLHITGRKAGNFYDFFEPSCEYELVTDSGTHQIREYCISYLFSEKENSSNSEIKFKHLQNLLAKEAENGGFVPDYIISVSTSESTSEMQANGSVNGCVIMGSKFYAKDCRELDEPKETSNLDVDTPYMENIPPFYNFFNLINGNQQILTDGIKPMPYYSANKLSCITNPNYVSLGVINITNYACYSVADPKTYEEFKEKFQKDEKYKSLIPEGLETTHAVVKMAAGNIPVLFVSPIVDRYEHFNDDVDGKWGNQNRTGSYNAGVVVANMLEYFRNELGVTTNEATEVKLSAIKKGMFLHIDMTKQSWEDYHIRIVDEKQKEYLDEKVKGKSDGTLKHVSCESITAGSDDLRLVFCEFDSNTPKRYKILKTSSELRNDKNELKAVVYSIQLEDGTDDDYNDLSIQITAWTSKY